MTSVSAIFLNPRDTTGPHSCCSKSAVIYLIIANGRAAAETMSQPHRAHLLSDTEAAHATATTAAVIKKKGHPFMLWMKFSMKARLPRANAVAYWVTE